MVMPLYFTVLKAKYSCKQLLYIPNHMPNGVGHMKKFWCLCHKIMKSKILNNYFNENTAMDFMTWTSDFHMIWRNQNWFDLHNSTNIYSICN